MTTTSSARTCGKPVYPLRSIRLQEEGISLIGFLIRTDGTVARAVILNSSGSADLDRAAIEALSRCDFKPGTWDGKPADTWTQVEYVWSLRDNDGLVYAKRAAAQAAAQGDPGARYQLSMILRITAETDADRGLAKAIFRSAAELGVAHAQYEMGLGYEKGTDGLAKDAEKAMAWYQKAAAQGDVLAIQRVQRGKQP